MAANTSEKNPSEKKDNRKLWIIGLLVALLCLNGVLLYMQHQKTQQVDQLTEDIKVKDSELENQIKVYEALKVDFERQSKELQTMGLANDSLEARIASVNADLLKLQSFRNTGFSTADRRRYEQRAANLERQIKQRDQEIARLKQDNEVLYGENTQLKNTQNILSDTISTLKSNNQNLSEKVAIASRLQAEKINVNILNKRGKEKDDDDLEYRARQVDRIKVTFNIAKNDVATKETKEIMMRLIEPDGSALFNLATGSGTFMVNGEETYYTAKRDIVFDNSQQAVTFVYSKGAEYKRGQHTVELYADGFVIGTTTFTLK